MLRVMCAVVLASVCVLTISGKAEEKSAKPKVDVNAVSKGNNEFAFDLYRELVKKAKPDENILFSPLSIRTAFAMAYAGARGDTAKQIAKVMRFDENQEKFHPAFAASSHKLRTPAKDSKSELLVANGMWADRSILVAKPFETILAAQYKAPLQRFDFNKEPETVAKAINDWVSTNTRGMIEEIISKDDVNSSNPVFLANAVYFKDQWKSKFEPTKTKQEDFHTTLKLAKKVPMMRQVVALRMAEAKDYRMLELPYTQDRFSMLVLLPNSHDKLSVAEADLKNLNDRIQELSPVDVIVGFPRFTVEESYLLRRSLSALGMPLAVNGTGDYSGASSEMNFNAVVHAAKIENDEEGTKAAAVTLLGKAKAAPGIDKFICDRPFLLVIRENESGHVLFLGRICQPS